ncbi:transposase [Pseudomonas putida]|nr:transposase [Pseudomonas putida]
MHQTKKGGQYFFGMKAHIGADVESGLVHHVHGTAANVADVTQVAELLHGWHNDIIAHGDSSCARTCLSQPLNKYFQSSSD